MRAIMAANRKKSCDLEAFGLGIDPGGEVHLQWWDLFVPSRTNCEFIDGSDEREIAHTLSEIRGSRLM